MTTKIVSFTTFMEDGAAPTTVTAGVAGAKPGDQPPISTRLQKRILKRGRGMNLLRRRMRV